MAKFRRKPIMIDAVQWTGSMTCLGELQPLTLPDRRTLQVVEDFIDAGPPSLAIQTLEGEMVANPGDWIIKGVKGDLYPCKPDIFAETYEEVRAGD
jgi:hypothetical protein